MAYLIETRDHLNRDVVLTDRTWEVHILRRRPWMEPYLYLVERAIMAPLFVNQDKEYADRECFYLACKPLEFVDSHLKVVVAYNYDRGRVVTAFPHRNHSAGESRLWPT